MNFYFTTLLISISNMAMAGQSAKPELPNVLNCVSDSTKNVLSWNEGYGELEIVSPQGEILLSQDTLIIGSSKYVSNVFPKAWFTDIDYGDEEGIEPFATIKQFGLTTEIIVGDDSFRCE